MTKLYHDAGEGWQIPGQQSKAAERIDVPNPPAELAAWLNARQVPPEGDAFDGLVPGNAAAHELLAEFRGHKPEPQLASAPAIPRPPSCGELVEFVLDGATVAEVELIFSAIGTRFAELRKEARQ